MRCWRFIMAGGEIPRSSIPPRSGTATLAYRFVSVCLLSIDRSMCRTSSGPAFPFCWLPQFCISYALPCSEGFPGGWDGCSLPLTWFFYTKGWEDDEKNISPTNPQRESALPRRCAALENHYLGSYSSTTKGSART